MALLRNVVIFTTTLALHSYLRELEMAQLEFHIRLRRLLGSLIIVTFIMTTGCSAAFYGIKPDPNDFREQGLAYCEQIHAGQSKAIEGCVEYENTARRARALENAYLTLERVNRWSIFVGTTIALASVGALTGLYAFGEAASHAAKIIPIAGTFAGSVIAYLSNDAKADAYEDARYEIGKARARAEATILPATQRNGSPQIGRDPNFYNAAQIELNQSISSIEIALARRIRQGRPSLEDLLKKSTDLEKDNQLLAFVSKYKIRDIHTSDADPSKIVITLNQALDPKDAKILADNGAVKIEDAEINHNDLVIGGDQITFPLPPALLGLEPKSRGVAFKIGSYDISPIKTITLP